MYLIAGSISRGWPAAAAALLVGLMLMGCGSDQQPRNNTSTGSHAPALLCPFLEDDPELRLVQWALGCEEMRQSAPPSSAAVAILHGNTQPSRVCIPANSLLAAPDGQRVFAAGDQGLYVMPLSQGKPVPVPVHGAKGWRFTRLLAFERHARPLAILAEMVRDQGSQQVYGVWRIEVRGNQATAKQISRAELPGDASTFFSRYLMPRCERDHQRCIVVLNKGSGNGQGQEIGVGQALIEIQRGGMTSENVAAPPGTNGIIDASWVPGKPGTKVLLVADPGC